MTSYDPAPMSGASRVSELAATAACDVGRLSVAELIELATGTRPEAAAALAERGLRGVLRMTADELTGYGLTDLQAARLHATGAMLARAFAEPMQRGEKFTDAACVYRAFHLTMRDLRVEQFRVLLLDGKHRLLRDVLISQGTLTSSPVHPREVFAPAIRESAAAVVLVHNHPSGDPAPSADDIEITSRLSQVGAMCGVRVVDHVIIGDGTFTSLADRGLMR